MGCLSVKSGWRLTLSDSEGIDALDFCPAATTLLSMADFCRISSPVRPLSLDRSSRMGDMMVRTSLVPRNRLDDGVESILSFRGGAGCFCDSVELLEVLTAGFVIEEGDSVAMIVSTCSMTSSEHRDGCMVETRTAPGRVSIAAVDSALPSGFDDLSKPCVAEAGSVAEGGSSFMKISVPSAASDASLENCVPDIGDDL